jgi:rhodanese-related sulfurtransferase
VNTIDLKGLKQWQAANRPFLLVNVLDREAFEKEHIPGSKNVPLDHEDFVGEVGRLAGTKDRTIAVYCASTQCDASSKAAERLDAAGFKHVYDFEAGMQAWNKEGASKQPSRSGVRR